MHVDDVRLLGIPRSRSKIARSDPYHDALSRLPRPLGQGYRLVECISVTRVRPRTSKGITDLLLPPTSFD